uniref:Uncharacterized protein n=1 Tax=Toxoplasma gondii TgCATBr9 TaxID=943120 RepID=A0A2T6IRU0_TOXGO|nr:hypothetical protein TGBR9_382600 [Toxoplasma gondii TgCATBr9]
MFRTDWHCGGDCESAYPDIRQDRTRRVSCETQEKRQVVRKRGDDGHRREKKDKSHRNVRVEETDPFWRDEGNSYSTVRGALERSFRSIFLCFIIQIWRCFLTSAINWMRPRTRTSERWASIWSNCFKTISCAKR